MGKSILEATVKETKKCRYPSKFYVYVLEVTWSEGTTTVIYRRYSDFFEFQCGLLEKFPEEGGAKDPAARIIPFLPGKRLLGRSQVRSVAQRRKDKLNDYCRALIRLPPHLSDDEFVLNFFELRPEDLVDPTKAEKNKTAPKVSSPSEPQEISEPMLLERYVAIADYNKQKKNECSLHEGQMVEVIDKNQNGWWFVSLDDFHEGWVPATFLDPLYGQEEAQAEEFSPGQEQYVTTSGYHAQNPDELSFERGVIVDVLKKGLDGWWRIKYKDREGMAPAAFLSRYHGPQSEASNPTQLVGSVKEAILQASGSQKSPRAIGRAAYVDKEPIYAPTPRKMAVQKQAKRRPPPPKPFLSKTNTTRSTTTPPTPLSTLRTTSPSTPHTTTLPTLRTTSPPASPNPAEDGPEPLYEVIPEPEEEEYVTMADFTSSNAGDGLSFTAGSMVSVVTKNPSGWWFVEMGDKEGWVPSSYLEKRPAGTSVPTPSQKLKSVPVKLREPSQPKNFNRSSPFRRSASEDSLATKMEKPSVKYPRSPQPKHKSPTVAKVASQSHVPASRKNSAPVSNPTGLKILHMFPSEGDALAARKQGKKLPAVPSNNTGNKPDRLPQSGIRPQRGPEVPKNYTKSILTEAKEEREDNHVAAKKPVAELTRMLQQRQVPQSTEPKSSNSNRRPFPATSTPSDPARKLQQPQQPPRPAKRTPPKRPEPSIANTISAATKKPPPRPANSPALKRKDSYAVACDYEGGNDGGISLKEGQSVEVLEKNADGWWYVKAGTKEGWAPSTFLEEKSKPSSAPPRPPGGPSRPSGGPSRPVSRPSHPQIEPKNNIPQVSARIVPKACVRGQASLTNMYRAVATYKAPANDDSGVSLVANQVYEVLEKDGGWWYVKDGQKEGWAPASYLDPA